LIIALCLAVTVSYAYEKGDHGGWVVEWYVYPFRWPYYSVPVSRAYHDSYYQFVYPAPPYVMEVPPLETTTAYQQGVSPETMPLVREYTYAYGV